MRFLKQLREPASVLEQRSAARRRNNLVNSAKNHLITMSRQNNSRFQVHVDSRNSGMVYIYTNVGPRGGLNRPTPNFKKTLFPYISLNLNKTFSERGNNKVLYINYMETPNGKRKVGAQKYLLNQVVKLANTLYNYTAAHSEFHHVGSRNAPASYGLLKSKGFINANDRKYKAGVHGVPGKHVYRLSSRPRTVQHL